MKPRDIPRHRLLLCLGYVCVLVSACNSLGSDRLIYNEQGIRVGIEADPTVSRSAPPGANAHPANIDPQEVRAFLELFQVSGWSGTLVGFLDPPRPFSLFDNADLHAVTMPIAEAFRKAGPRERVFFSIASILRTATTNIIKPTRTDKLSIILLALTLRPCSHNDELARIFCHNR